MAMIICNRLFSKLPLLVASHQWSEQLPESPMVLLIFSRENRYYPPLALC
jgi:hypothetical protein